MIQKIKSPKYFLSAALFLSGILVMVGSLENVWPVPAVAASDPGQSSISREINYERRCEDFFGPADEECAERSGFYYARPHITIRYTGRVLDNYGNLIQSATKLKTGDVISFSVVELADFNFLGYSFDSPPAFWVNRAGDSFISLQPDIYKTPTSKPWETSGIDYYLYYFASVSKPEEELITGGLNCERLREIQSGPGMRTIAATCTVTGEIKPYLYISFGLVNVADNEVKKTSALSFGSVVKQLDAKQIIPGASLSWSFDYEPPAPVPPPPRPTLILTAAPTTINPGESAAISWEATNATSCTKGGNWQGSAEISCPGGTCSEKISPAFDSSYSLTCAGPGGQIGPKEVSIKVNQPERPLIKAPLQSPKEPPPLPPPLSASCQANNTSEDITIRAGDTVTWTAYAGGGTAPYGFEFIGSDFFNSAGSGNSQYSAQHKYAKPGLNVNSVIVTDSNDEVIVADCDNEVTVKGPAEPVSSPPPLIVPEPTAVIKGNNQPGPLTVKDGDRIKISWNSTHTENCWIFLDRNTKWTGTSNPGADSEPLSYLRAQPYTYILNCSGLNGSLAMDTLPVYVSSPPPPSPPVERPVDLCPNLPGVQSSVPQGTYLDPSGNCVNLPQKQPEDQLSPPAGGSDGQGKDVCPNIPGNQSFVPPDLVIDGSGNCVTPPAENPPAEENPPAPEKKIKEFKATPSSINPAESSLLSWSTIGHSSCSLDHGLGSQPTFGNRRVYPLITTTYTLNCEGGMAQTTVTVSKVPILQEILPK